MKRFGSHLAVFAVSAIVFTVASAQSPYPPAVRAAYPPPPQAFATIVQQAPQQSSFTLDRSMLAAADGFLNGSSPDGRRIVAGLNSMTFTNFHYHDFANYNYSAFNALSAAYEAAGYHHLVNGNPNSSSPVLTDLWLRTQGTMVTGVVVLTRGDRNMNAINVDCNLRPLDLLHLSGHFGIPQVDASAVMVPAPPPGSVVQPGPVPNVATGPIAPAPDQPMQNPPTLHRRGADGPQ